MWRTPSGGTISDTEPYVSSNGTSYPPTFPKSEIDELLPVQIVAAPAITQYQTATQSGIEFVGGVWRQVWTVTNWTQGEIDAFEAPAKAAISAGNYKAMILRRADELRATGDRIGALELEASLIREWPTT